jgi:hypothetical protein
MTTKLERRDYAIELEKRVSAAMELIEMVDPDGILADERATKLVRIILGDDNWMKEPNLPHWKMRIERGTEVMTIDGKAGVVVSFKPIHDGNNIYSGALVEFADGTPKRFKLSELIAIPDATNGGAQ